MKGIMIRTAVIVVVLGTVLLAAPASRASGREEGVGTEVDAMLERILAAFDRAQSETGTLVARFTETKHVRLLARPVESRGVFYYHHPNQVRWEHLEPDAKILVITQTLYRAYYPALKRAEEIPFSAFVGKRVFRFIGVGQSTEDLRKYYSIRLSPDNDLAGTHLLALSPRRKRIQDRVREVNIWVDAATYLPRRIEYREADGDSTTLTFDEIRRNVEIASSRFQLDLPRDVRVSETFSGLGFER